MHDNHTSTLSGAAAHALGMALGAEEQIIGEPDYPHDPDDCPDQFCSQCERERAIDIIAMTLPGNKTRGLAGHIYDELNKAGHIKN